MARMIPPHLPEDCRSPGEILFFTRFRDDPGTHNWVVLHSLGVARHPKRLEGEIDFVVIVPNEGVLCLEIKAGKVSREQGIWKYGQGPFAGISAIGPFKQASEAMHALRTYVRHADPSLGNLLFFSGVFFTYIDFDEVSSEWHSWQHANRTTLTRSPVSICCLNMLHRAHEHIRSTPSAHWYNPVRSRPSLDQVKRLVDLLRGDFEYFVSPRVAVEKSGQEIYRFTEEQFSALDVLEDNDRIVYKGPAGTGKTLLAIEAARRSLLAGRRTLLVCYNALLGHWLRQQTAALAAQHPRLLTAGTLHRLLFHLSGLSLSATQDTLFWSRTLPETVLDRILAGIVRVPLYDTVIIDEAQDLITEEYLDVLDFLLEGGIDGGRWVMFGDFERQAIYTDQKIATRLNTSEIVRRRSPVHFNYPLRINCRNAEPIAVGLELACKLQPVYSRILHVGQEADIDVGFYQTRNEQILQLRQHLSNLMENFRPAEIVVLFVREDQSSCACQLGQQDDSIRLRALREEGMDSSFIGFTTIHAFKGMEAPAVVLTDIEEFKGEMAEALLYVGMSRARLRLIMLMHENCRKAYLQAICESFSLKGKKRRV